MSRYVKNESEYRKVDFEPAKIKAAMKRRKESRKQPTSVALDPELILELKAEAKARGVPYQVLMRMFIIDGFKRLKRAS
ncbi:MAG TPA: CopG family antitoxin [Terriglobales bacterium]|nr:CopG family antitoxin [Terriglobales bacterium]